MAAQHNLTVFPYYALASGFLSGKYRSAEDFGKSVRGGGAAAYLNEKGLAVLHALDQLAAKHNSSPATVSLAWLLHQTNIGAPIVSATSKTQLETLLKAPSLILDSEDLQLLDAASR